jgi:hypothetical protein
LRLESEELAREPKALLAQLRRRLDEIELLKYLPRSVIKRWDLRSRA